MRKISHGHEFAACKTSLHKDAPVGQQQSYVSGHEVANVLPPFAEHVSEIFARALQDTIAAFEAAQPGTLSDCAVVGTEHAKMRLHLHAETARPLSAESVGSSSRRLNSNSDSETDCSVAVVDQDVVTLVDQIASPRPAASFLRDGLHCMMGDEGYDSHSSGDQGVFAKHRGSSLTSTLSTINEHHNAWNMWRERRQTKQSRHISHRVHGSWVLDPRSPALCTWSVVLAAVVLLSVWADSLSLTQDWNDEGQGILGEGWEWTVIIVFSMDIILSFNTAYEDGTTGKYVTDHWHIAKHYTLSWFTLDLVCTFPWDEVTATTTSSTDAQTGKMLRIAKVLKVIRVVKILKMLMKPEMLDKLYFGIDDTMALIFDDGALEGIMKQLRFVGVLLKFVALLLVQSHCTTCILLSEAKHGNLAWKYRGEDASSIKPWRRYAIAMLWSLTVLATGNTDDHHFTFTAGRNLWTAFFKAVVATCFALNALFSLAIFTNTKGSDDMDFNFRLRSLNIYLRKQEGVSGVTRRKVLDYHRAQSRVQQHKRLNDMLTAKLPKDLKLSLASDMYSVFVEDFKLFSQGGFQKHGHHRLIFELCSTMNPRGYPQDQTIVSKGVMAEGLFCVISGEVMIVQDEKVIGNPRFFAIESLFALTGSDMLYATYDAIATTFSQLGLITREAFDKVIKQSSEWSAFCQFVRKKVSQGKVDLTVLPDGISDELVQAAALRNDPNSGDRHQTKDLGMACNYLVNHFTTDLVQEIGEFDISATTFKVLRDIFWSPDEYGKYKGFKKCGERTCPRDGRVGAAIVDSIEDEFKSWATHYMSWCWDYSVETVVSSLRLWAAEQSSKAESKNEVPTTPSHSRVGLVQPCFWMCFFCNNQRKVLIDGDSNDLLESFGDRLQRIGHMVMMFDSYAKPFYISRVWCIFESYKATTHDIPIDVAMPESSVCEFQKQLRLGQLASITESLTAIDVESARATYEFDERKIKNLIRKTAGFTVVNDKVKVAVMRWLTKAFQACLVKAAASDVAQMFFGIIVTNDAVSFNLKEWMQATRQHPGLLDYLELDGSLPEEDFQALSGGTDENVSIQELEAFLVKLNKNNMISFAKWLHRWADKDQSVRAVQDYVEIEIQEKMEELNGEMKRHSGALAEIQLERQGTTVSV